MAPNAITEAEKIVDKHVSMHGHKQYWTGVFADAMIEFHNKCQAYLKEPFQENIITTHINNKVT